MLENLTADGLSPHVHDAPTFTAMYRTLNRLGVLEVPAKTRNPVLWELCDRLGFSPSKKSFNSQMSKKSHRKSIARTYEPNPEALARAVEALTGITEALEFVEKLLELGVPEGWTKTRWAIMVKDHFGHAWSSHTISKYTQSDYRSVINKHNKEYREAHVDQINARRREK